MSQAEATAEAFLTALRSLPKKQRQAVLCGIADDDEMREDLLDLAMIAERRHEPSRPFREYLAEKKR
ncbi:MAG: hypothetical protein FJ291_10130 [Planctomycetes bacterium]|nr:hypothetical protein [Planctomycetota bacterium]